ncbi:hypothetical protein CVIRNUC_001184 [Coccomyxa viridis]|uniref:Uncharacterized protein n=1 Tax=Coccomyxa viridis TaxID=1274662 RepID=A0AAV1HVC9_9CHLO|nr:hypothetical protein CVIRNUC_001184 [Coccomyxa viridis]
MVITRIILPFILTRTCEARSLALESEEDLPAAVSNQLAGEEGYEESPDNFSAFGAAHNGLA